MPAFAPAARSSQLPLKKARSPNQEASFQPLTVFGVGGEEFVDLLVAVLHAEADLEPVDERQFVEFEASCPAPTPILASLARMSFSFSAGRRELQREVEIFEEVALHQILVDLGEIDLRRGGRRRLAQIGGQRLHLVAGLDLLHVVGMSSGPNS